MRSSCLGGRRRCWRGRCAPGRRHICCGLRFRRIIVRIRRNGRAWYGLRAALIGRDGLQPCDGQFQRIAWPVSSSCRIFRFRTFASISRTRPAFRSLAATFRVVAPFRVFGAMRQRSLRSDASKSIARCVSVSLGQENSSGSSSRFWWRCRRHHREPEPATSRAGPNSPIISSEVYSCRRLSAL